MSATKSTPLARSDKRERVDFGKIAPAMDKDQIIVITISGRGDKDCAAIARYRGEDLHE